MTDKQTLLAIISDAHDLIEDDINWLQTGSAADEYGEPVDSYLDPAADMFTGVAAIGLACHKHKAPLKVKQDIYMHIERVNRDLVCYINMRGHQQMLDAFTKAMEALQ